MLLGTYLAFAVMLSSILTDPNGPVKMRGRYAAALVLVWPITLLVAAAIFTSIALFSLVVEGLRDMWRNW